MVGRVDRYHNHAERMKLLRLLLVPIAALTVLAVRLLYYAGVHIRFGGFVSHRLGHLCGNTNVYLSERATYPNKEIHIWTHYGAIANKQMAKMIARVVHVWPQRFTVLVVIINKIFSGWERHDLGWNTWDRDPYNLNEKCAPPFYFTDKEEARGKHDTASLGIPLRHKWICLMVRDGAYLPMLGYHAYRDSDIDTYAEAALALARRGYYVVRMGEKVEKPFSAKHPRIIDYATSDKRTDFLDIYLAARCYFAISTCSGMDSPVEAFRRPMCFVNLAPVEHLRTHLSNSLAIWKHYEKNGKRMSIQEIVKAGAGQFLRLDQFQANGITLIDNSPQEIRALVEEMADLMEGRFRPEAQEKFWKEFPRSMDSANGYPLHGVIHSRIGSKYLEEYYARQQEDIGLDTSARRIEARSV